jgi:hypothetical protein
VEEEIAKQILQRPATTRFRYALLYVISDHFLVRLVVVVVVVVDRSRDFVIHGPYIHGNNRGPHQTLVSSGDK